MRQLRIFAFALGALVASPAAWAQPTPAKPVPTSKAADAAKLKKDADALMDADRYVDALALYVKAYELTNDPALLYNQGRALEAMGEYGDALDKLEKFDHDASPALRAKLPGLKEFISDLRGRVATVVITSNVPGARLLVREKAMGTIQKETKLRTRAGAAVIEVLAEGYVPFRKEMELAGGSTMKVDAVLQPKKADALVVVRSRPTADISFDGKAMGRSPLELHVAPGSHVLSAQAEGRETQKVPMTLALGDRRELDLDLKPTPGILSRWWFWTGIGVVVAAGAVTAIALTQERDPTPGTFGPGIVTGP
jgi:tetratricopeptide (TPR) repeat protein